MVIGRNDPRLAKNTGLKEAIAIGLDEALTALGESIHDLTDEQVAALPIPGRNNIAWIVMHVLGNLDHYANYAQSAEHVLGDLGDRWGYESSRPQADETFPSRQELMDMLKTVGDATREALAETAPDQLTRKRPHTVSHQLPTDFYMRTIWHTMAHLRQIWLLRGALGLTDGKSWPQQHWA